MNPKSTMTAAEFAAAKLDLPESGRWHELHLGRPVMLSAPDDEHGVIVLNLTRMLAMWFRQQPAGSWYACHELGLQIQSQPDSVIVPAVTVFNGGELFAQTDRAIASETPRLVIDVASSNDRRKDMRTRTLGCLQLGVETIWIPDPFKKEVQIIRRGAPTLALGRRQILEGGSTLPGFEIPVEHVFSQPDWWTNPRR
jgi:Uma2 family endonuclease